MNIFILSRSPKRACLYHCDTHTCGMPKEYAQMICTNLNLLGMKTPYKNAHINHPCTKWARESSDNFWFLCEMFLYLSEQYSFRYKKEHLSYTKINKLLTEKNALRFEQSGLTPFAQAIAPHCKKKDAVKAYRHFYHFDKASFAKWDYTETPYWWKPREQIYYL